MDALQWVNDKDAVFHYHDSMATGIAEIGYVDRGSAAISLLRLMEEDNAAGTILMSAVASFFSNRPEGWKQFCEIVNKK